MNKIRAAASLSFACLVAPAFSAGSNPVASDTKSNTAMGTSALQTTFNNPSNGQSNTAAGYESLLSNTTGNFNTAIGSVALEHNTTGYGNTGIGFASLVLNSTGNQNTATGMYSLYINTDGSSNSAYGYQALFYTNHSNDNTATGVAALYMDTSGSYNVADGSNALRNNTYGTKNSATGWQSLYNNISGSYNTANGSEALHENTIGYYNSAVGYAALRSETTGWANTAIGAGALDSISTGSYNIAIGNSAGYNISSSGSSNIDIGSYGDSTDNGVTRIGTQGQQTSAYIAGVYGVSMTGAQVVVNSNGQLGVIASSERFKTDIQTIVSESDRLERLRPVTFRLKSDPQGPLQYGLIAEEVAQVYPDLVVRDSNGRIDSVRYDELAPLLLKHMQLERQASARQNGELRHRLETQEARIGELERQLTSLLATLPPGNRDSLVADAH